jgi:hypothetical protein
VSIVFWERPRLKYGIETRPNLYAAINLTELEFLQKKSKLVNAERVKISTN